MSRIFLSPQTSHGLHDQGFIWRGKVTPARGPLKLLAGMDAARPGHVGGNSPSVCTRARGPNIGYPHVVRPRGLQSTAVVGISLVIHRNKIENAVGIVLAGARVVVGPRRSVRRYNL